MAKRGEGTIMYNAYEWSIRLKELLPRRDELEQTTEEARKYLSRADRAEIRSLFKDLHERLKDRE